MWPSSSSVAGTVLNQLGKPVAGVLPADEVKGKAGGSVVRGVVEEGVRRHDLELAPTVDPAPWGFRGSAPEQK